jgi:hypothetical protein
MAVRKPTPEEEAAYFRGMALLARKRRLEALAESYEMGAKDVLWQQPSPKGDTGRRQ